MRFKCSMCGHVFASNTPPTQCPECEGTGRARYGKNRMPTKRLTNAQRRQVAKLDPALVQAFREAQVAAPEGGRMQVKIQEMAAVAAQNGRAPAPEGECGVVNTLNHKAFALNAPEYIPSQAITRKMIEDYKHEEIAHTYDNARGDDVRPDAVSPECLVFGECEVKL